ncbi:MAG: exodeoxyribonuclease VII small subunit [Gammaproteobacteria bacterium]|jgi:exodeoxyribonuclease VII small subunit|nr:exodeoxyribonuclease VII small subunit [Gammaproteobacteria bacterium]
MAPRKKIATKSETPFNFEQNLSELEQLVERMENEELPLEDSLKKFEQGIQLIRSCQNALTEAEQKVEILTKEGLQPFNPS